MGASCLGYLRPLDRSHNQSASSRRTQSSIGGEVSAESPVAHPSGRSRSGRPEPDIAAGSEAELAPADLAHPSVGDHLPAVLEVELLQTEMNSRSAMSLLVAPSLTSSSTSISRLDNSAGTSPTSA